MLLDSKLLTKPCTQQCCYLLQRPWHEYEHNFQIMYKVGMGHKPPIPDKVSPEGKDFLCHCLESDPKMRWTASQLLDHPFVKVCLMALAPKTVDGNWKQLLVGLIVCSYATGLCIKVGDWYQVDAVQKTRYGNFSEAHVDVASKHLTKNLVCTMQSTFTAVLRCIIFMLKRLVKLQLGGSYLDLPRPPCLKF